MSDPIAVKNKFLIVNNRPIMINANPSNLLRIALKIYDNL